MKDIEILSAIKSGNNQQALNHLYKDMLPRIRRLILKNNGTEDDAKDIFQDTVLILFNQLLHGKYDTNKELGGFMYSVARNLWISKIRKDTLFKNFIDTESKQEFASDPLSDLISDEKTKAMADVMNMIGEDCKQLLDLSLRKELSLKEIALKMGYSNEGVAKTYNYRCKQKFIGMVKSNPYLMALFK